MLSSLRRFLRFRRPGPCGENTCALYDEVRVAIQDAQAYARSHGGDIQLVEVTPDGDVKLRLRGACASCPLSGVTIKAGVEERLREQVPAVRRLILV